MEICIYERVKTMILRKRIKRRCKYGTCIGSVCISSVCIGSVCIDSLCIDSLCHNCGHKWESEEWRGKCPKCGSENISQKTIVK